MPVNVKIVVTDAPPLITLAAAQSLDYLLYPALPIIIPDAVYYEATGSAGKLGAQQIIDWSAGSGRAGLEDIGEDRGVRRPRGQALS